jgi:uncharacterized protein (TIGR02118 family)
VTSLFRLAKRARGLAVEEFQAAAEKTCDWSAGAHLGLRRATQALTMPGGYRKAEPVYDVVDELTFDDEDAAFAFLDHDDVAAVWHHELLHPASVTALITQAHVAKDGPIPASYVKNFEIVTKLPSMDRAEFDRYWAQVHGPLAAQIPTIRRYEQAHLAPAFRDRGAAMFDGLAITWWDDVDAMREGTKSPVYAQTREDEHNFLDGELPFIIATERVTFDGRTSNATTEVESKA